MLKRLVGESEDGGDCSSSSSSSSFCGSDRENDDQACDNGNDGTSLNFSYADKKKVCGRAGDGNGYEACEDYLERRGWVEATAAVKSMKAKARRKCAPCSGGAFTDATTVHATLLNLQVIVFHRTGGGGAVAARWRSGRCGGRCGGRRGGRAPLPLV